MKVVQRLFKIAVGSCETIAREIIPVALLANLIGKLQVTQTKYVC